MFGNQRIISSGEHEGYLSSMFNEVTPDGELAILPFHGPKLARIKSESYGGFADIRGPVVQETSFGHIPRHFIQCNEFPMPSFVPNRGPFLTTHAQDAPDIQEVLSIYSNSAVQERLLTDQFGNAMTPEQIREHQESVRRAQERIEELRPRIQSLKQELQDPNMPADTRWKKTRDMNQLMDQLGQHEQTTGAPAPSSGMPGDWADLRGNLGAETARRTAMLKSHDDALEKETVLQHVLDDMSNIIQRRTVLEERQGTDKEERRDKRELGDLDTRFRSYISKYHSVDLIQHTIAKSQEQRAKQREAINAIDRSLPVLADDAAHRRAPTENPPALRKEAPPATGAGPVARLAAVGPVPGGIPREREIKQNIDEKTFVESQYRSAEMGNPVAANELMPAFMDKEYYSHIIDFWSVLPIGTQDIDIKSTNKNLDWYELLRVTHESEYTPLYAAMVNMYANATNQDVLRMITKHLAPIPGKPYDAMKQLTRLTKSNCLYDSNVSHDELLKSLRDRFLNADLSRDFKAALRLGRDLVRGRREMINEVRNLQSAELRNGFRAMLNSGDKLLPILYGQIAELGILGSIKKRETLDLIGKGMANAALIRLQSAVRDDLTREEARRIIGAAGEIRNMLMDRNTSDPSTYSIFKAGTTSLAAMMLQNICRNLATSPETAAVFENALASDDTQALVGYVSKEFMANAFFLDMSSTNFDQDMSTGLEQAATFMSGRKVQPTQFTDIIQRVKSQFEGVGDKDEFQKLIGGVDDTVSTLLSLGQQKDYIKMGMLSSKLEQPATLRDVMERENQEDIGVDDIKDYMYTTDSDADLFTASDNEDYIREHMRVIVGGRAGYGDEYDLVGDSQYSHHLQARMDTVEARLDEQVDWKEWRDKRYDELLTGIKAQYTYSTEEEQNEAYEQASYEAYIGLRENLDRDDMLNPEPITRKAKKREVKDSDVERLTERAKNLQDAQVLQDTLRNLKRTGIDHDAKEEQKSKRQLSINEVLEKRREQELRTERDALMQPIRNSVRDIFDQVRTTKQRREFLAVNPLSVGQQKVDAQLQELNKLVPTVQQLKHHDHVVFSRQLVNIDELLRDIGQAEVTQVQNKMTADILMRLSLLDQKMKADLVRYEFE